MAHPLKRTLTQASLHGHRTLPSDPDFEPPTDESSSDDDTQLSDLDPEELEDIVISAIEKKTQMPLENFILQCLYKILTKDPSIAHLLTTPTEPKVTRS